MNGCLSMKELTRSEEHTSELQSRRDLVCRLLLEKKISRHPGLQDDGVIPAQRTLGIAHRIAGIVIDLTTRRGERCCCGIWKRARETQDRGEIDPEKGAENSAGDQRVSSIERGWSPVDVVVKGICCILAVRAKAELRDGVVP